MLTFSAFELFYAEKTLKGSYYGSADVRSDFNRMLNLWRNGRLDLEGMITKKIAIDDVDQAVADLRAGTVIRSVITFDDDRSGAPAGAAEGSASTT
jgi:S-(hydroxymethyl)glutathione dehydrogenase/alcohol dehydrogenase